MARTALLAMLALVLLPAVAQAFARAQGGHAWAEICTPQGMKLAVAAEAIGAQPDAAQQPAHALGRMDHCPLCASTAVIWTLPAVCSALVPPEGSSAIAPPMHPQKLGWQAVWLPAHPRAPPHSA